MDVLKRFPIKYVRDYIKKDYKVRDKCYICGSKDDLELHHSKLHTLYGQNYSNHLVPKVKKWLDIQKDKLIG